MSGLPVDRHRDVPVEDDAADDTTTAEAGPPASAPPVQDDPLEDEEEDRTVQVAPVKPARRVPPGVLAPPTVASPSPVSSGAQRPVPSAVVSSAAPSTPLAAVPSTQPSGAVPVATPMRTKAGSTTETKETAPLEGELGDDDLTDLEEDDGDSLEDSITATAPRLDAARLIEAANPRSAPPLPIAIPGSVEIRSVEHDELLDETEVRTRPGHVPLNIPATLRAALAGPQSSPVPSPRPAAGRPPSMAPSTEVAPPSDDDDDDGVTTQAQAPRVGSVPELGASTLAPKSLTREAVVHSSTPASSSPSSTDPVPTARTGMSSVLAADSADELATRPGVEGLGEPATQPGVGAPPDPAQRAGSSNSYANEGDDDDDGDESITTRGHAVKPFADDASALDDGTDGTTQKVKRNRPPSTSSPADGEVESITTQAPGPLTNMLRVIASGSVPDGDADKTPPTEDEDEEAPENRTAVMPNAPLKRIISDAVAAAPLNPIRPTGPPLSLGPQASAAARLEPSSESGLRIARTGSPERSAGQTAVPAEGRTSGILSNALASDGSVSAPIDVRAHAATELAFPNGQPSLHDIDLGKGPRYGLLVGIVAVISVMVPITLFLALRKPDALPAPGEASEPASELETPGPARAKAARTRTGGYVLPSPSSSAAPKSSASAKHP